MPGRRLKDRRNKEQEYHHSDGCQNYARTNPVVFDLNDILHRDRQFVVLNLYRIERFRVNMDLTAFPYHFRLINNPRELVSGFSNRLNDPGTVAGMEKIEVLPVRRT